MSSQLPHIIAVEQIIIAENVAVAPKFLDELWCAVAHGLVKLCESEFKTWAVRLIRRIAQPQRACAFK
jgi:hypothetical protein